MKLVQYTLPFIAILVLSSSLFAQRPQKRPDMRSPERTFKALVKVIKKKDLYGYRMLWAEEQLEREAQYDQLANSESEWEELQGIFKGPQKIIRKYKDTEDGQSTCKLTIEAPKAEGGGIGTLKMVKVGAEWRMWSW